MRMPFVNKLERIRSENLVGEGELIDFISLSIVEQKTLHFL